MTGTLRHNHYIIGIKKILMTLLVSMFLCPAMLWGQDQSEYKVSGIVKEAKSGRPLEFCKIYVTDSLGQQVRRTITLDDGIFRFSVKDGSYSVLFTNTGHRSVTSSVKVAGKDVDMGEIFMEIGEEIDGAGVSAAPLLTLTGDRYIYDVSRDPDKDKISMTEMMTRIPQLRTASKDGKLEFNNEKVAEIRINDTKNGMISASRQYPMEFIKAGYMKTIELVMPDSPEYHNEHPILLITLARPLPYGFAGNIEGQANTKNAYSPAVDLVANTPIIGVGVSYEYGYSGEPALTNKTTREMTDGTVTESKSVRSSKSHSHNMGMNIFRGFLNDRIRFNASLSGSFANASSFSESTVNNVPSVTSTGTSQSPFRLNGAVRLSGSFGPETVRSNMRKHQWSLGYSYRDSYRSSETEHVYPSYSAIQSSYNDEREHRLQATLKLRDIVRKPFTASLYLQGGWFGRKYDNSSAYDGLLDGMDYRQDVAFLEMAALGSIVRNLSYTLQLNGEYIDNSGSFINGTDISPLDYRDFNIVPSAGLSWRIRRHTLSASYYRSVRRPAMSQLNPYEDVSDPYNIRTGNPHLKGENTDSYSLNWSLSPNVKWMNMFSLGISYSDAKNRISPVVITNADGIATRKYYNIGELSSINARLQASLYPVKSLNIYLTLSYSYNRSVLPSGSVNHYSRPVGMMSFSWSPKWFELSGTISVRPTLNSVQTSSLVMEPDAEISISRYFSKPHLGISIGVTDLFHSGGAQRSTISYDNFVQYNYRERTGRTFAFRIYWRFGKFRQTESVEVKAYDML